VVQLHAGGGLARRGRFVGGVRLAVAAVRAVGQVQREGAVAQALQKAQRLAGGGGCVRGGAQALRRVGGGVQEEAPGGVSVRVPVLGAETKRRGGAGLAKKGTRLSHSASAWTWMCSTTPRVMAGWRHRARRSVARVSGCRLPLMLVC